MKKKTIKIETFIFLMLGTLVGVSSAFSIVSDADPAISVEENENIVVQKKSEANMDILDKDNEQIVPIYFFGREGCGHCQAEKEFFEEYLISEPNVLLTYYDVIKDLKAQELFEKLIQANNLSRMVPYTFIGGEIVDGFGTKETTGRRIIDLVERAKHGHNYNIEEYLNPEDLIKNTDTNGFELRLPVFGVINTENVPLFSLSVILGLVDGFNPCALWVLMTFLLILMQIGDRKKMFYVAGLFIFAESIMYYLILNVWYKTWDFIALDRIITPLIGIFTIACGGYFLYKYSKTKNKLTCDVTSIEKQTSIQKRIHKLVNSPMTLPTIIGIVGIALSVNVIEFACSVGIPQAFTKILEINALEFWVRQGYLFLYIFAYMIDDLIVFGFALYGFDKIHQSQKYSKLSILIGGILMIILGAILLFAPNILIF